MKNLDEIHEYLFQAQPIVDIANRSLNHMFGSPKRGYISQESRNKARKRNRK
jgi:hypothetical protein